MEILNTIYDLMQEREIPALQEIFNKTYNELEPTTESDTQAQNDLFDALANLATTNHKAGFMQGFQTAFELFTGCTQHTQGCPLLHNDLKALLVPKWLITDTELPEALKILYLRLVICYGTKQPIQSTISDIRDCLNMAITYETLKVWLNRLSAATYITFENIDKTKGIYKLELLKTL